MYFDKYGFYSNVSTYGNINQYTRVNEHVCTYINGIEYALKDKGSYLLHLEFKFYLNELYLINWYL